MQKQLTAIKNKLPKRGYITLIIEAEKTIVGKGRKRRFSEDEAKNLFNGRSVRDELKPLILQAAALAIVNRKAQAKNLRKMAAAA